MSDETVENGPPTPADAPETPAAAAPTLDLSPIEERMNSLRDELQSSLSEQFQQFASRFEEEEDDLDPDDPDYDQRLAEQQFEQLVNERVQKALTPFQEQQMVERREAAYAELTKNYTDLANEDVAGPIVKSLLDELGDRPDLINSPWFVKQIEREYLASKAREQAAKEIPAGERKEVLLEGAGGAAPSEPEEDIQDRVWKAAQQLSGGF